MSFDFNGTFITVIFYPESILAQPGCSIVRFPLYLLLSTGLYLFNYFKYILDFSNFSCNEYKFVSKNVCPSDTLLFKF